MLYDDAGPPVTESLGSIIDAVAREAPSRLALLAPQRAPLTYHGLSLRIHETVDHLRQLGIAPGDRIATLLPDGAEAAVTFLSVSALATCAPMNPAYSVSERHWSLRALSPAAVIVPAGAEAPAAAALGIRTLELSPVTSAAAGTFTLTDRGKRGVQRAKARHAAPAPSDAALILHTSGTTSSPKLVVHTRRSVCCAATYVAKSIALSPADRCLNFAPHFHSLGLFSGIAAPLAAGGSVVCTSGFRMAEFLRWLQEFSPTWYSAVPAIHETILGGAADIEAIPSLNLRFVRSTAAPLPGRLKRQLAQVLRVPVIESYGMSEAPPIATELMPPHRMKANSVGVAAGPWIEVLDEQGNRLPRGHTGEIAARGPNVACGYWQDEAQTRAAFVDGWFRTGDRGYLDDDGFLFVTGRIKELINRGGEKITPLEVDEVLMDHPAVAQALTFPVPDEKLGEEIAAAVVLRANASASAAGLQAFLATRLAPHKIPRHIVFLTEMPAGATGKLSRRKLTEIFTRASTSSPRPEFEAPRNRREQLIAEIWAKVLEIERVGIHDNFFDSGGDSLRGAELLERVSQTLGTGQPPLTILLLAPTIAALARVIDDPGYLANSARIVPIQPHGSKPPFFCIGDGFELRQMIQYLDGQPCFGLRIPNFENQPPPHRVEAIAAHCRETMQSVQPHGPYMLGGWCFCGVVAFELARQLRAQGEHVSLLALFDARNVMRYDTSRMLRFHSGNIRRLGVRRGFHYARARALTVWRRVIRRIWSIPYRVCGALGRPLPALFRSRDHSQGMALHHYAPQPYPGRVVHFWAAQRPADQAVESEWANLTRGGIEFHEIPGDHISMFQEPGVRVLASKLCAYFNQPEVLKESVQAGS